MAIDKKAYALANGYTDETVIGGGAIKGKNCTISKIEDIDGGHRITFGWTLDNGTTKSQTLDVKDGADGHTPVKGVDYFDGDKGDTGEQGISGIDGKDGTTYTPSIGEVTTVESNVEASASVSVNTETKEAVFNFAIPKGNKGLDGVQISDNETVEDKTWSSSKIAEVETELNAKLNGKADKNAVLNSLEVVNGNVTAQIIPGNDGTHYRGFEDKSSNTYTDILLKDGVVKLDRIENNIVTKSEELATMDKIVPSTRLEGGFQVVAYSDRAITGNSKLECLENWVTNALSKYDKNLTIIGNIFNTPYADGFAIVNVWGNKKDGILGASGILVDQEGMYYYKTQNGVSGSGTLTKIN